MKKSTVVSDHCTRSSLSYYLLLMITLIVCLYACASTPPATSETQTANQPSQETPKPSDEATTKATSAQQTNVLEPATTVVMTVKASLRAEPNHKGKIIAKVNKGEKVLKLSTSGSWLNVELSDKTTGWVLKKQTKEEK